MGFRDEELDEEGSRQKLEHFKEHALQHPLELDLEEDLMLVVRFYEPVDEDDHPQPEVLLARVLPRELLAQPDALLGVPPHILPHLFLRQLAVALD